MNKFIEGLKIMAPFYSNGMDTDFFMEAEHDIVYFHIDNEQIPEESKLGERLVELGFHYDEEADGWAKFT